MMQQAIPPGPHFDGATYEPEHDKVRLIRQIDRVRRVMTLAGCWFTLDEIHKLTGAPHASISARLRDLRKDRFGCHLVERRARGERADGLFEYRIAKPGTPPTPAPAKAKPRRSSAR